MDKVMEHRGGWCEIMAPFCLVELEGAGERLLSSEETSGECQSIWFASGGGCQQLQVVQQLCLSVHTTKHFLLYGLY